MALEKKETYDYEVRGEYKIIQQRCKTSILENGKEISFSYKRKSFNPSTDISAESDELKALADSLWTDAVKKAWADKQAEEV